MRNILRKSGAVVAFLILAGAAVAQDRDRDRDHDRDWYQQREERFRDEHWRGRVFAEVREDLNHVQTATFGGRDEYRLARTKQELDELQGDLAARRYNEQRVDDVINAMQRVVADNRMSPRDREILNQDLQHLREFREHHERWGQ